MTEEDDKIVKLYNSLTEEQKKQYLDIHGLVILDEKKEEGSVLMEMQFSDEMLEKLESVKGPDETLDEVVNRSLKHAIEKAEETITTFEQMKFKVDKISTRLAKLEYKFEDRICDDGK